MSKLWSYKELKKAYLYSKKYPAVMVAEKINEEFHDGIDVRSGRDVERIKNGKNIFNHKRSKGEDNSAP